jgi:hypothetical protein
MKQLLLSATLTLALGVAGAAGDDRPGSRAGSGGVSAGGKGTAAGTAGKGTDTKTGPGTTPKTTAAKKGTDTPGKTAAAKKGTGKSGKVAPLWVKFKGKNYKTLAGGYKKFSYRSWYRWYKCWCYYDPYGLGWCFWSARYNCFLPIGCISFAPPATGEVPDLGATPPVLPATTPPPPPPPPPGGEETPPPDEGQTPPPGGKGKPPAGGASSGDAPPPSDG